MLAELCYETMYHRLGLLPGRLYYLLCAIMQIFGPIDTADNVSILDTS